MIDKIEYGNHWGFKRISFRRDYYVDYTKYEDGRKTIKRIPYNAAARYSTTSSKCRETSKLLGDKVAYFSLPAGWSCPFAGECLTKSDPETGELDVIGGQYSCYAANAEAYSPATRARRWINWKAVQHTPVFKQKKLQDPPPYVRIHDSGDFFKYRYFNEWYTFAQMYPDTIFFGYTKSVGYMAHRLYEGVLPDNLRLVVSIGGKEDGELDLTEFPHVKVFDTREQGEEAGYKIYESAESELALINGETFGLVIHGTQPAEVNRRIADA